MNIAEVSQIAQSLGSAAVVASLIFVGSQIRQNTRATRAASHHAVSEALNRINLLWARNREMSRIWLAGMSDRCALTPEDSGDLAYLSIEARYLLDQAGFKDAQIIASNDLDENVIQSLNDQSARIDAWGVGTKLSTAYDQPALGGVYKLSAIRKPGEEWQPKLKLSEQAAKISTPGISQVRRYSDKAEAYFVGDMIYEEGIRPGRKDQARRDYRPNGLYAAQEDCC